MAHRTPLQIPPAKCYIDHSPDRPVTYTRLWPESKESEDQIADLSMQLRGVDYHAAVTSDFLTLDVSMTKS